MAFTRKSESRNVASNKCVRCRIDSFPRAPCPPRLPVWRQRVRGDLAAEIRRESVGDRRRDESGAETPGAPPTMDLDGARAAVEQASTGLAHPAHRAQAEATLLEFRRSPHALPACRHILQTSSVMEACFQAAATLRDAALRDYAALPPEERAGLRQFCLGVVLGQTEGDANTRGGAGGGCPASLMPVVVSQLVSVLAVLIKRAWLDVDETKLDTGATRADYVAAASAAHAHRQSMLAEAERAVSQASNARGSDARVIGLNLFAAVITEFAPSTASAMQLPWDFHERCRVSLQNDFLQQFFQHAVGTARAAAETGRALEGLDGGVCVAALRLINAALAWDFQFTGSNPNGGGFGLSAAIPRGDVLRASDGVGADAVKIAPGVSWRDALLAPGSTDWVFELHALAAARALDTNGDVPGRAARAVAHAARQTVSSLCALAGDVFPTKREDPSESSRLAHFARCAFSLNRALRPARQVIARATSGGGDAEEVMTDGARGIAALAAIHAPGDFYQSPSSYAASNRTPVSSDENAALASTLGELTVCLLEAGALRSENDGGSLDETLRMCIEAWGALATRSLAGQQRDDAFRSNGGHGAGGHDAKARPAHELRLNAHSPPPLFPGQAETSSSCAVVFEAYLRFGLAAAAAAAHEEDDGQEEEGKAGAAALDERLALAASVARASPDETLPLLRLAMEAKKNELGLFLSHGRNGQNRANADPAELLEQLWWLARVVPHVLCDAFEGEFPLPPDAVAECARRAAINDPGGLCPVTETGGAFLNLVGLCLDENAMRSGFVSPRLVEQLIWGAARWTDTYLMPEDVGGSAHAALFGGAVPTLAAVGLGGDAESRVRGGAARDATSKRPSPFSEAGGGGAAADALIRVALVALTAFPGEESAQRVAAKMLLPALTRRRALCRACVASNNWAAVADAAAQALSFGKDSAVSFAPEIHRFVTEALCRAAEGVADEAALDTYVQRVLTAAGEALVRCASNGEDMKHPLGEARAVAALEALRGAARASAARSQRSVFVFFSSNFEALVVTQSLGTNSSQVTKACLRLCEAFVEAQACFASEPSHAAALCAHCARVISVYKETGRGVLPPSAAESVNSSANSLRAEQTREAYKEVKALLRILTHVSSVDAESDEGDAAYAAEAVERGGSVRGGSARGGGAFAGVFGPGSGSGFANGPAVLVSGGVALPTDRQAALNDVVDVAAVVLAGLHAVIPLLTEELLKFPKLCHQYFSLLAHMFEAYPGKVAALDHETFATLMRTLEFGLTHSDVDIGRESFAALSALAAFHHQEVNRVGAAGGLGAHNAPKNVSDEKFNEGGILARFLRLSLNRLLFEDASVSLAEPAADALLPLILSERSAFERVANDLIVSLAGDERAQRAVSDAIRDLTADGGLTDRVDRANRRRFRRNVSAFVLETRAFVRKN